MSRAARQAKPSVDEAEMVRRALQVLQDAYLKRNLNRVDYVAKEILPADGGVTIIGTSGMLPGEREWPLESAGAKDLMASDWRSWGNVFFNVAGARIRCAGDSAWIESNAFVEKVLPAEEVCENHLRYIRSLLEGDLPAKEKVAEISRGASNVIQETMRGERYVWPMRFTAVLQKEGGRWVFRQMHFSFPTTRFPDERITELDELERETSAEDR